MKSLVLALFLSSSTAVVEAAKVHRHRGHHGHVEAFGVPPQSQEFLLLESGASHQGILEKVQQKLEKEEQEKQQIRIAKEAQDMQERAYQEAEMITRHKILRRQMQEQEVLQQSGVLIDEIKKGNVNAQQLAQIILGQADIPQVLGESLEPLAAPASAASISAPVVQAMPAQVIQEVVVPAATKDSSPTQSQNKPQQATQKTDQVKKVTQDQKEIKESPKVEQKPKETGAQKPQSMVQRPEGRAEDLEDSISSIAQRVIEEKQKSQAADAKAFLKEFKTKNSEVVEQAKVLTLSERASKKFKEEREEDHEKVQVEEAFENPISEYFANRHPDVLKKAQERHYLNDQV